MVEVITIISTPITTFSHSLAPVVGHTRWASYWKRAPPSTSSTWFFHPRLCLVNVVVDPQPLRRKWYALIRRRPFSKSKSAIPIADAVFPTPKQIPLKLNNIRWLVSIQNDIFICTINSIWLFSGGERFTCTPHVLSLAVAVSKSCSHPRGWGSLVHLTSLAPLDTS